MLKNIFGMWAANKVAKKTGGFGLGRYGRLGGGGLLPLALFYGWRNRHKLAPMLSSLKTRFGRGSASTATSGSSGFGSGATAGGY